LKAITFDCYGTLVDWESGIAQFLHNLFREKGVSADVAAVAKAREDIEFDLIMARYRRYRDILAQSLKESFHKFNIPYSNRDGERLAESVPDWPIFADTQVALNDLVKRYKLAIISNIDNDIISKTKSRIGAKFHLTVTAQIARAYKPAPRPFQIALGRLRLPAEEILHVSSGYRYDMPPARELGFRTAWVNRKRENPPPGAPTPDYQVSDLIELAGKI